MTESHVIALYFKIHNDYVMQTSQVPNVVSGLVLPIDDVRSAFPASPSGDLVGDGDPISGLGASPAFETTTRR